LEHYLYFGQAQVPEKLLAALRLVCLNLSEANQLAQQINDSGDLHAIASLPSGISPRNEAAALELLDLILKEKLHQYQSARQSLQVAEDQCSQAIAAYVNQYIEVIENTQLLLKK